METRNYWEENGHAVKFENYNSSDGFSRTAASSEQLGFTPPSEDEADYQGPGYLKKGKVSRQDPMSHRIIEKRRRDRMNNCLADLSRLIPLEYLKKGRGRVEKTEIIEMAIRHIKFLQERANAEDKPRGDPTEHYRAGFQEAVTEAVRFLVEAQGYAPGDGLCVQIASHLHRHCEHMTKGDQHTREKARPQLGNSSTVSETASSSSSSQGYVMKTGGVIARAAPQPDAPRYCGPTYDLVAATDPQYPMECERVPASVISLGPDEAQFPEDELDLVHKSEPVPQGLTEPAMHGVHDMSMKSSGPHNKVYKRRRAIKPPPCASTSTTSNSGSTEDAVDTSPQDTSSESPHHHYEKPALPPQQFVPVFALNALGKYYVPLSVEYSCLVRHLGPHDVLDSRASSLAAPLHPVTIHVNFQPCLNYQVKRERDPSNRDWRAL